MPVLDLSFVTRSFVRLLDFYVRQPPGWDAALPLEVLPLPPDRLTGPNALGFYLYHLTEDPAHKNAPPPGNSSAEARFYPLTLQLHYILSPRSEAEGGFSSYNEQRMLGLAMRTLRDFPLIDDTTETGGVPVFSADLATLAGRQNRFRIVLQPAQPNEAVQYWTAGTQPLRLSAYYMVTGVQIEPEPLTVRPGRVYQYGVFTFLRGSPRIDFSASTVAFTLPDGSPRTVEVRPAEATYGELVTLHGTELAADETALLIQHGTWQDAELADPILWSLSVTSERVAFAIQTSAGVRTVLPGIYMVRLRVSEFRDMLDGTRRSFPKLSNQTAFAVAPRIASAAAAAGLWTITGEVFSPADLPDEDIQLFLGPDRLARVNVAPGPGEFQVVNGTQIDFRQFPGTPAGTALPLRLIIRGAENSPRWIVAV
jgi:hypothetical protein